MKPFKLIVFVESFGDAGWIAWIESIKGMVVQADTLEEAFKELLISWRVKFAYDNGIPLSDLIQVSQEEMEQMLKTDFTELEKTGRKELNFSLA